jgi:hypothetical protein
MPAPEAFTIEQAPPLSTDGEENAPADAASEAMSRDAFKAETQARVTDDAPLAGHTVAPAEVPALPPIPQDGSMVSVILAIVAVVGGGAAWKFYSQSSREKADQRKLEAEQAHDLAMAELNAKISQPTASPPPCIAAHTSLEARLSAVEAKTSRASVMLPDDFNAEELTTRIAKLEKASKAKPKRTT